jgi:hypothetical protein
MGNIIYYLVLFTIVFVINAIKVTKLKKSPLVISNTDYISVSLQIVLTSAGLGIALMLNLDQKWVPAIFVVYIAFFLLATFLETLHEIFSNTMKVILNVSVIVVIVLATILSYTYLIPNVGYTGVPDGDKDKDIEKSYTVIVPYFDRSLARHIGYDKMMDKIFFINIIYQQKIRTLYQLLF